MKQGLDAKIFSSIGLFEKMKKCFSFKHGYFSQSDIDLFIKSELFLSRLLLEAYNTGTQLIFSLY